MRFRLDLTAEELNAVVRALESQPYRDVAALLHQVHGQAAAQVQAAELRAARKSAERAARQSASP